VSPGLSETANRIASSDVEVPVDYALIGAGPAGLQLGWFLGRAGRNYTIFEAGPAPGTFYRTFPRHRRMISINKPHTGWDDPELDLRMDWNSLLSDDPDLRFTHYTDRYFPDAGDYLRYLADYASACGLRIEYRTPIARVARAGDGNGAGNGDGGFTLTDGAGRERHARRVVVATGFGRPHLPPIPGIEEAEGYGDVSVDRDDFTDQRVLASRLQQDPAGARHRVGGCRLLR